MARLSEGTETNFRQILPFLCLISQCFNDITEKFDEQMALADTKPRDIELSSKLCK